MSSPRQKSYFQILGQALSTFASKIGVNDFIPGSVNLSLLETVSQLVYRATGDIFAILRDYSVDRATGDRLRQIAFEERVDIPEASVATGLIKIYDSSIVKRSTKIYAGANPPNIGSTAIKISSLPSGTPGTGQIYIGRGASNAEGPISYSAITPVGSYYEITLSSPTNKYHNISEAVVFAQAGLRTIPAGTIVKVPGIGNISDLLFTTTTQSFILDGEVETNNVPIAASEPGSDYNASVGAIKQFSSAPFSGASVTNLQALTNGRNEATDEEIRNAIKRQRSSKGLGSATAIENSVFNAQAPDEAARVTSSKIVADFDKTTLYVDDGNGYEEKTSSIGIEYIVDSAIGGEQRFQLSTGGRQSGIAKAFLEAGTEEPFSIYGNDRLNILVGGISSEHIFKSTDFRSEGSASAYEAVASINANADLTYVAKVIGNGKKFKIEAKTEVNEYLEVTEVSQGVDSSLAFLFTSGEVQTLRLYKNKKPLEKDGRSAEIETRNQADWSNIIATGETLIIKVDGTSYITYSILDSDFIAEGSYTSVNKSNSLQSWSNVFNSKLIGITTSVVGNKLKIKSNRGSSSLASLEIDETSTLVVKGMFDQDILNDFGKSADYQLSRNTAQFKLLSSLDRGDSLTAGTEFTKAFVQSNILPGGQVSLSVAANLWVLIDNKLAEVINTGVVASTIISVSKPSINIIRYTSNIINAFSNVQVGDYFINWSAELSASNRLEGRINAITNTTLDLRVTPSEYASAVVESGIVFNEGFCVVRTEKPVQKISIPSATYEINDLAQEINDRILGAEVSVDNDETLIITSKTRDSDGAILIVSFDDQGKAIGFDLGEKASSDDSLLAFYESSIPENNFPLFVHSKIDSDSFADPDTSFITTLQSEEDLESLGIDPNVFLEHLNPYGTIADNISYNEHTLTNSISTVNIGLENDSFVKRIREDDRIAVVSPYNFSSNDSLVTILDGDPINKTFVIPLYRKAQVNSTMPSNSTSFRAYDIESGNTAEFSTYFGNTYSFQNYKVLMKARNALNPKSNTVNEDSILYRAAVYGKSGEKYNIGYLYPTASNQAITSTILNSDKTYIRIFLKSGNPVSNNIDSTTEWNIAVIANSPVAGVDTVTYTYSGIGTAPSLGSLSPGNYVTINGLGEFSSGNLGTFKVDSSTATSFTVLRPNGVAIVESNIATLSLNTILLYENSDTTAAEIVTYVNASLSSFVSASLLNDNGLLGAGIIDVSTYEDSSFVNDGVDLFDGINWISSSNLSAAAPISQFTFKKPLILSTISTATLNAYTFNSGEEIRIIPVSAGQLESMLNVLAVSGFSTVGSISSSDRSTRLQLSSGIIGSSGSIQVSGGIGSFAETSVINQASKISGTNLIKVSIPKSFIDAFQSNQYIKISSVNYQKKDIGISSSTIVTISSNSPVAGKSIIELDGRNVQDPFFGKPKTSFRDEGRKFFVEKHGTLTCISWDGVGANPNFSKSVNVNGSGGGNISVDYDGDLGLTKYTITSGNRNFCEVNKGDIFTISSLANSGNNGSFSVAGISEDKMSVIVENILGVDALSASVASGNLSVSTELKEGDFILIDAPFATLNRGRFPVIRRFNNSIYIENLNTVEESVTVSSNLQSLGFDITSQFDISSVDNGFRLSWNGIGTQPDFSDVLFGDILTLGTDFSVANQGSFTVLKVVSSGATQYIDYSNASASAQTGIVISDILQIHRPAIKAFDFDSSSVGDSIVITGDVLDIDNIGSYAIEQVLDMNRVVVGTILTPQVSVPLSIAYEEFYMEEGYKYSNYKRVEYVSADASNSSRAVVIFDSNYQYLNINESSGAALIATGKLSFPVSLKRGVDGYKYYIGMLAQVNRIIYGDPRDPTTYPGIAAAGAEIFPEAPLFKRIQVSISIRLNTGVPFSIIVEQVRNNISALIKSSPIGTSIAISDIVSVVNSIPGIQAVAIDSPQYDSQNDLIVVNPGEKPIVLDSVNDISVSKVD